MDLADEYGYDFGTAGNRLDDLRSAFVGRLTPVPQLAQYRPDRRPGISEEVLVAGRMLAVTTAGDRA
jgi:hypothetical protein